MVIATFKRRRQNMNTLTIPLKKETIHAQDEIAGMLSILPGLGHIYKGHYAAGFLWMFFGMPVAIWIGILLGLATAGARAARPDYLLGGTGGRCL